MAAGAVMRRSSISISIIFHALFFAGAMVSIPWLKKEYTVPQHIAIEMVDIAELTQTTKQAPVPVKKQEKPKKVENPPPPKPKTTARNTSKEAVTPDKTKTEVKEDPKKDEKVLVDPNAHPDKKLTEKEEKKKKVTEEPKKDFSSVLKNLADEKPTPVSAEKTPDMNLNEPPEEAHFVPLGKRMTMTEADALRKQLEGCWIVPYGAKDAENTVVEIAMVVNRDRTLYSAKIVDTARYSRDSFFRAMADSAMRAVRNPNCSPFALPPDKYESWKRITVTFNPSDMF